jgi:enoyl-CoA hydratase/carnithine racemase
MSVGRLHFEKDGAIARIVFDNPSSHNALTHQMWLDLRDACRDVAGDPSVRVLTFRGAGGRAFVSGTDISGFAEFRSGRDGVEYERGIDECMAAVDAVPAVTIAVVEGWAVGGGLNISSACDFRIATPDARFGSPLGRTIGNCLSMSSYSRVIGALGPHIAKRMLLLGETLTAPQLLDFGFLTHMVEPAELDAAVAQICERARENAPLTTRVTKEAVRRLRAAATTNIDDLVELVYGSNDFRLGVDNFLRKNKALPQWSGS